MIDILSDLQARVYHSSLLNTFDIERLRNVCVEYRVLTFLAHCVVRILSVCVYPLASASINVHKKACTACIAGSQEILSDNYVASLAMLDRAQHYLPPTHEWRGERRNGREGRERKKDRGVDVPHPSGVNPNIFWGANFFLSQRGDEASARIWNLVQLKTLKFTTEMPYNV